MPLQIIRNDITHMEVDAIVNAANETLLGGGGVDGSIHRAAGPELLEECRGLGGCPTGEAKVTSAYRLPAKYVIHTVGPVWEGGSYGEEALLRSCYDSSLALAKKHRCRSIAFPLISTGNYGFPKDKALQIAIAAFSAFLIEHEMQIYLVVFDQASYRLSEKLFQDVATYIGQNYVDAWEMDTYGAAEPIRNRRRQERERIESKAMMPTVCEAMEAPVDLDAFLKKKDAGFVETLLELIRKSGQKNSTIYKRANISKQHFSKLINDPRATITKPVAVALALALELDLDATRDLIGRAGYTLTNSSYFDLVVQFHIEKKKYNVVEINVALYEYDQPLLGVQI